MISSINDLLNAPIVWREELPGGTEFYSYLDGDLCQLTLNDFPAEPLYTLRWRESSLHLDDRPHGWRFIDGQ